MRDNREPKLHITASVTAAAQLPGADAKRSDHWLVLDFIDNGPGMPEDMKDFAMIRDELLLEGRRGVGLLIIKKIVDLAGGYVELVDHAPRGTRVHVELPTVKLPAVPR